MIIFVQHLEIPSLSEFLKFCYVMANLRFSVSFSEFIMTLQLQDSSLLVIYGNISAIIFSKIASVPFYVGLPYSIFYIFLSFIFSIYVCLCTF